jgi:hypothetical protein
MTETEDDEKFVVQCERYGGLSMGEVFNQMDDLRARLASAERLAASYADTAISLAISYDEREAEVMDALMALRATLQHQCTNIIILPEADSYKNGIRVAGVNLDATIAKLCPGAEGE